MSLDTLKQEKNALQELVDAKDLEIAEEEVKERDKNNSKRILREFLSNDFDASAISTGSLNKIKAKLGL